jgi:hypothetical protein
VDGLFAADEYITFFEHGVSNVDWLELHPGGSFLSEASNTPNFAYWGIQSVHLLAEVGDELLSTTTTEADVRIHASQRADGSVAVMVLNMNPTTGGTRTVNFSINGDTLSEDGVMYQTNGDTALSMSSLSDLGNSFSTSIAGRTLQLFVIPALPPTLAGDYNDDGVVDAADYTVWRNNLGGSSLTNETVTLGVVDAADYDEWKANYGSMSPGGGSAASPSVPEPSTPALIFAAALAAVSIRPHTRRGGAAIIGQA